MSMSEDEITIKKPYEYLLSSLTKNSKKKNKVKEVESIHSRKQISKSTYKPIEFISSRIDTLNRHYNADVSIVDVITQESYVIEKRSLKTIDDIDMKYTNKIDGVLSDRIVIHKHLYNDKLLNRLCLTKSRDNYANFNGYHNQNIVNEVKNVELLSLLNSYYDILIENKDKSYEFRNIYVLHILNHVLKRNEEITRNSIVYNEINKTEKSKVLEKLEKEIEIALQDGSDEDNSQTELDEKTFLDEEEKNDLPKYDMIDTEYSDGEENYINKEEFKDQGFTKAKVLILVPFKQMAAFIVDEIVAQFNDNKWKKISKKKKFFDEFKTEEESLNDCFRIGVAFYGDTMKLYSSFYQSDIIIASPLGLRLVTGQEGENETKRNYDFLSSIEILVLDNSEVFQFQNMEHLEEIFKAVNVFPKKLESLNDINRIKPQFLDKVGNKYRQTIINSHFRTLDFNYLIDNYCSNYRGYINIREKHDNILRKWYNKRQDIVTVNLRKINVKSLEDADDNKFSFFTKKVWDKLYENLHEYTVIFVASYFDYLRLLNFFQNRNASVAQICEYQDKKECQRNRAYYESQKQRFILITERSIFFEKIKLRYAKNLIVYSLPDNPDVFQELLDITHPSNEALMAKIREKQRKTKEGEGDREVKSEQRQIYLFFTKYESMSLERIIGSTLANKVLNSLDDSFKF